MSLFFPVVIIETVYMYVTTYEELRFLDYVSILG
jgi:hypothetical protein